jgi:UDP-N-acetylmuramate dehydrogenase
LDPLSNVALAPRSTMRVGGSARYLIEARDDAQVIDALRWASERALSVRILGGGSNVVVSDAGTSGLVIAMQTRGVSLVDDSDAPLLVARAGESWDALVALSVSRNLQGIECLSGIPGLVGATPIQNVGAYGQEVAQTIESVRVVDRRNLEVSELGAAECGFSYRHSRFKHDLERYVVLEVRYRLSRGAAPRVTYPELERHLRARGLERPSLVEVRESVLAVRAQKSMLLDASDPNGRSCGSFFVNPIVGAAHAAAIVSRAGDQEVPRWGQPDGRVKLAAAWLIEQSGFEKGTRRGPVGLSTRHALSIVCHDGARAADVLGFSREIVDTVREKFGVELAPEPVIWA